MEGPDSHSYERIPFPTTEDLPSFREDKSVVPSSPDDTHFDASIYYNAFSKYLASYSVKGPIGFVSFIRPISHSLSLVQTQKIQLHDRS